MASCANDLDGFISIPDNATGVQQISTRSSFDNLRIVYHGKVYETLYTIIDDSIYSYQNSEVKDLMDNLSETRPNLRTFIHGNGVIEYFDDENDFNLNISRYVKKHEGQVFVDLERLRHQREELLSTLHGLEREMKKYIDN